MKHVILVKFVTGTDVSALIAPITEIFEQCLTLPGIHGLTVRRSNSNRPNRYDLMIELDMDKAALPIYDASAPHLRWKTEYGSFVEKKAIFDYD